MLPKPSWPFLLYYWGLGNIMLATFDSTIGTYSQYLLIIYSGGVQRICVSAVTLNWIVQNYLQICSWLLQFTFVWYCGQWPYQPSTYYSELTGPCCDKVTSIYSQCSTAAFPSLVTHKIVQDQFVDLRNASWKTLYLHFMLATSLPYRSLRSNKRISLLVPRVKTNTGATALQSRAPSLWNKLPLSVRSAISVATFKKWLKTQLFYLTFPP